MSTKTSFKRVALVAVAALGMGVLTSVSPANAVLGTVTVPAATVIRSATSGTTTFTVADGAADAAATETITLSSFTYNGVALATVPAGITGNTTADVTSAWTVTTPSGGITFTMAAATAETATVTVANTMPVGKYTVSVGATGNAAQTLTFYISTAPTTATYDAATYSAEGTASATAQIALTDAQGNPTYLLAGEAVKVTSSATAATSSISLLDSGNYTATQAAAGYVSTTIQNTAGTAGSYTYTVAAASGQTGFNNGTATLTVAAAPAAVDTVTITAGSLLNGAESATAATYRTAGSSTHSQALADTKLYVSPSQTSIEFNLSEVGDTTAGNFKIQIFQTGGVPFPGGVSATAAPIYLPATLDADGTGSSAKYKVTTTSALAGTGYTLRVEGGTYDINYLVSYVAPVAYTIALADTTAGTIAAVEKATATSKVKVTDQYGVAVAGAVVTYSVSGRNTIAAKTVTTDAAGLATVSTTDAALTTATGDDTIAATIPSVTQVGGKAAGTFTQNSVIKYYDTAAEITAATVTLAAERPDGPTSSTTYDSVVTTSTTETVTVDTNLTNSNDQSKIADQVLITATIANAAAGNPQGVPVSVKGSEGVYFLSGSTIGDVPVGTQTGAAKTLASYTASGGTLAFQAAFTKAGTATITVTSGAISKTYSVKVLAATQGIVKATAGSNGAVTALVTDLWGNPVSGVSVTFAASSGALLGGNFAQLTGITGTDGIAAAVATGGVTGKTYVVTATISSGDSAAVADTTNGLPAGVASSEATTSASGTDTAGAAVAALVVLVNKLLVKINTMQTLLNKIQKKLGVK
jgi:adhesin/invasin